MFYTLFFPDTVSGTTHNASTQGTGLMTEKFFFLLFVITLEIFVLFLFFYLIQCRWVQQRLKDRRQDGLIPVQLTTPQHKEKVMQKFIESVRYVTIKVTIKHPDDSDANDIIDECDYRLQPDPTNGFHVVMETEMIDISEERPL